MDGRTQFRDRERSYASPTHIRTASRSSTSTSATRRTPQSPSSSSSHFVSSPRPSSGHPSHRFHHTSCAQSTTTSRPASVVSRDRGSESGRQSAASSYLQEKLQKRREEADRLATIRSVHDMNALSEHPPRNHTSPSRGSTTDGHRPRSGGGSSESPKKKGMGLKEMEATVSTLHKQNFDLKLELFHRRERQTALEDQLEALEAEKAQADDVNDKLLDELEKRDKALQEAVQMIVSLEARVETLLREREMVRQVDAAGYMPSTELGARLNGPTAKPRMADLNQLEEDAKTLNRMPSFVSEHNEKTDNLRKVYLNSRGSLLSLPRAAMQGMDETDGRRVNSLTSPSLSILSESSFLSVYGEREDQGQTMVADADEPPHLDGLSNHSQPRRPSYDSQHSRLRKSATTALENPNRQSRSSSINRVPGPGQFQSIYDIIDHNSPLQQLARLDRVFLENSPMQERFSVANTGQTQKYVKDIKRERLARVTTDAPPNRPNDQVLPPTPDTISTSTLRRFKNSDDTLSRQRDVSGQSSYPSISEDTSTGEGAEHNGGAPVLQRALISAFGKEPTKNTLGAWPSSNYRPRSADESTISHRKGADWESDVDSVHSLDSSLDIWLQQGKESKGPGNDRSESPDLFNFPPLGGGWPPQTDIRSIGGPFNVSGLFQEPGNHVKDLMSAQEALFPDTNQAPPPPNRRSSLGAQTKSPSRPPPVNGKLRKSPSRSGSRRNSVDVQMLQLAEPASRTSQQPEPKSESRPKDGHYPPSSVAAPRGRRLNFFRRSIGGGSTVPLPEPTPVAADEAAAATKTGPMGMPSWVQRSNLADDDRASATPPPVMRNSRFGRAASVDEGAPIDDRPPMTPTTPVARRATLTPVGRDAASAEATPTAHSAGGGASLNKRKWLPGFGRASSLRNRGG
ncbi:uncharacterized protein CTRU02_204429 [Colletotrichum truncatum]|uniref:Uncharacterized protein n=1 Tax=Colletotrichum truncatum TaxID=5467 RepID=A0ACC3ZC28_COLTU|nr:uncharacterized protein CTRU02_14411 [Colletotrichum truncatum]KAF6782224.1 hypothetical protein CTRU02_14411 [Colletotrichum truncatum]